MNTSVKDRFSNVIAWLGFLIITTAFCCFALVVVQFAWHLVSPIADYDTELQERWSYLSRTSISSDEELRAEMVSLKEVIATKQRELSKLESNRIEVGPDSAPTKDTLTAAEEREVFLAVSVAADRDALQRLSVYADDGIREIVEYGKSRWRKKLANESVEMAVTISYFLPLWALIVLLNYVMVGSFRLLPWRGFEE